MELNLKILGNPKNVLRILIIFLRGKEKNINYLITDNQTKLPAYPLKCPRRKPVSNPA